MTHVRGLVEALAVRAPGRPRLTWYGPAGERVELTGRVFVNWVVKATNLLAQEADAGPGTRVLIDLPPHWRTVVWAVAAWTVGAEVRLRRLPDDSTPPPGPPAEGGPLPTGGALPSADVDDTDVDVVVTDRPDRLAPAVSRRTLIVAVALPALALRFPDPRPAGSLDGAADLMTYGDTLDPLPAIVEDSSALDAVPHAALVAWARAAAGADAWPAAPRCLVGPDGGVAPTLAAALAALSADGSLVLVGDPAVDPAALGAAERVTVTVPTPRRGQRT